MQFISYNKECPSKRAKRLSFGKKKVLSEDTCVIGEMVLTYMRKDFSMCTHVIMND